jgi:transposase InsO family protein
VSTQLVLDALEQAVWTRTRDGADLGSVVAHTDRGAQYVSIRYTERLHQAGIAASVGSVGDFYDKALAETIIHRFASAPAPQPHDTVPESLAVLTPRELDALRLVARG